MSEGHSPNTLGAGFECSLPTEHERGWDGQVVAAGPLPLPPRSHRAVTAHQTDAPQTYGLYSVLAAALHLLYELAVAMRMLQAG